MPSLQRGQVVKRGNRWGCRWYNENGTRRFRGGFATKSGARSWVDDEVKRVEALRRGDIVPVGHRPQTVDALIDMWEEKHGRTSTRRCSAPTRAR